MSSQEDLWITVNALRLSLTVALLWSTMWMYQLFDPRKEMKAARQLSLVGTETADAKEQGRRRQGDFSLVAGTFHASEAAHFLCPSNDFNLWLQIPRQQPPRPHSSRRVVHGFFFGTLRHGWSHIKGTGRRCWRFMPWRGRIPTN